MKKQVWQPAVSLFLSLILLLALSTSVLAELPGAVDDTANTTEDTPVDINVLANDYDADSDNLTVISVSDPANGTAIIGIDFIVTYTPDLNFNGDDSFTYTVDDGNEGTASATVTVHVGAENDPPTAADDSANTDEDTPVTIDVLANDSDIDGDTLTVTSVSTPANGSAVIEADYTVTYTPDLNFNGDDSFTYTVDDGNEGTASATVTVHVGAENDPPVAVDDTANTNEDTSVVIDVLTNDYDVDGDTLTVTSVTPPANGTAIILTDYSVNYTPSSNYYGDDSFIYTIDDGNGGTANATVTVSIESENDGPVADAGGPYTADEGSVVTFDASGSNDIEEDPLQYRWDFDDDGAWDTAWSTNATATYTWYDDWSGTARVEVTDGLLSDNSTATVTINNVPPVLEAGPDQVINSGSTLYVTATFTDAGNLDTHTANISWGDGTDEAGTVSEIPGSGNITGSHPYQTPGYYQVTVTVTDDDGGQDVDSFQVEVKKIDVTIDIKPGSEPNSINLGSNGRTPVAILTSDGIDATDVDPSTVEFGPGMTQPVHYAIEDVDGDGDDDMILHFYTQELGLAKDDTEATLTGQTNGGAYFTGTDSVRIVPEKEGKPDKENGKDTAPGQVKKASATNNGKENAPGQNKEPGTPADGKETAPGQNKEPGTPADGKETAPGQNKDPEATPAGKEAAPGQSKEPGENAVGKGKNK